MTERTWYVVRTNIKCEDKAERNLTDAGYEVYVPRMRKDITHHRTKRLITKTFVLFNRYLFVSQPARGADWYTLRACEGVECVLGVNGSPMPVPAGQVEEFRAAQADMQFDDTRAAKIHRGEIERTREMEIRKRFKPNSKVDVLRGPFGGFSAHVESVTSRLTVKAMVAIFGRLSPVEFEVEDIAPAGKHSAPEMRLAG